MTISRDDVLVLTDEVQKCSKCNCDCHCESDMHVPSDEMLKLVPVTIVSVEVLYNNNSYCSKHII